MQPNGLATCGNGPYALRPRAALARFGRAAAIALTLGSAFFTGASADADDAVPNITGASNGGIASASSGGEINIGQIITGENTGNSIETGNITGPAEISGGEIDYPTDVDVTQTIGPPIATADGGDYGQASPPSPAPLEPELNVDINNVDIAVDRSRTDNRSSARGIGEGGEGGEGGAGGNVIIGGDEPVE